MNTKLKQLLTNLNLVDLLRHLIGRGADGVAMLHVPPPGPRFFTYQLHGDDILVTPENLALVEEAVSEVLGRKVTAIQIVHPEFSAQTALELPSEVERPLLLAILDIIGETE